jgi:hypothetical protein
LGWIAAVAASPGWIGSKGRNRTDKRALKHQDNDDRDGMRNAWKIPGKPGSTPNAWVMPLGRKSAAKTKSMPETDRQVKEACAMAELSFSTSAHGGGRNLASGSARHDGPPRTTAMRLS